MVFNESTQTLPKAPIIGDRRVKAALSIIETDETGVLTSRKIAALTNLSDSRLRHLFTREVGVSLAAYIRIARYAKARRLLQTSFPSVKQVAAIIGANDVSHFVRNYKRLYGETPRSTAVRTKRQDE